MQILDSESCNLVNEHRKNCFYKTEIVLRPNYAHGEPENCGIGVYLMLQIHYTKQIVLY